MCGKNTQIMAITKLLLPLGCGETTSVELKTTLNALFKGLLINQIYM